MLSSSAQSRGKYKEPKPLTQEEWDKIVSDFKGGLSFKPVDPNPTHKTYVTIKMSDETFKFIEQVASVSFPIFGEKEYKINELKFRILTEEDYEQRYGKINE